MGKYKACWARVDHHRPLIAQAKQALQTNDFSTATALAQKASTQSELAITQAEHEKTNWVNNLPK